MRSRAARLTFGAVAWIAIGAAAYFLFHSERQAADMRAAVHVFDLHAREATDALADVRVGQQAYVAAGQGIAFWMPKVASTLDRVTTTLAVLGQTATSAAAKTALAQARDTVAEFERIDKRVREYLTGGEQLMAADVVFTEGGETAATAARHVEAARLDEHQALAAAEAVWHRQEAIAAAAAAAFIALIVAFLVPVPRAAGSVEAGTATTILSLNPSNAADDLSLREPAASAPPVESPSQAGSRAAGAVSPVLKAAAELCTDLGRVGTVDDLTTLVARAADVIDAHGLIVWLGNASGADLRPALAHGYSTQAMARMPTVPRSADNATAAAYRTGRMQVVPARADAAGAVIAPLLTSEGCVGALSAEIHSGSETSDSVQALAAIFAAQIAGILAAVPEADQRGAGSASL